MPWSPESFNTVSLRVLRYIQPEKEGMRIIVADVVAGAQLAWSMGSC